MVAYRRALGIVVAVLAACSSYGSDDAEPAPPRAVDDGGLDDAADVLDAATNVDAGPCDPAAPFTTFAVVPGLDTPMFESSARLSLDELTVYLEEAPSADLSTFDLFVATRSKVTDAFAPAVRIANVNNIDGGLDVNPALTPDGLVLFFVSDRAFASGTAWDIFTAQRATPAGLFGAPSRVDALSSSGFDFNVFVTLDGSEIWFASDRDGSERIYVASRAAAGLGNPTLVDLGAPPSGKDRGPVLSSDGTTLYFWSLGRDGSTGYESYVATRSTPTAAFSAPTLVPELTNRSANPSWLSPDACRLYYSAPDANGGSSDVYVATRKP